MGSPDGLCSCFRDIIACFDTEFAIVVGRVVGRKIQSVCEMERVVGRKIRRLLQVVQLQYCRKNRINSRKCLTLFESG